MDANNNKANVITITITVPTSPKTMRKGHHLKNRKVALAVSAGIRKADYSEEGRYRYTLEQLLIPFETTFFYCQADYRSVYAFYGTEHAPGATEEEELKPKRDTLSRSANEYLAFIEGMVK